jgi:hypothetical protein
MPMTDAECGDDTPIRPMDLMIPTRVIAYCASREVSPADDALVSDIWANGIHRPVEIATDGVRAFLIDGTSRLSAAQSLDMLALPVRVFAALPGQVEDTDPVLEDTLLGWLRDNHPHEPEDY